MPKAYVAFAQAIPLAMAQRLVQSTQRGWRPNYAGADAISRSQTVTATVGRAMLDPDVDEPASASVLSPEVDRQIQELAHHVDMDDATAPPVLAGGTPPPPDALVLAPPPGAEAFSDSEPSDAENEDTAATMTLFQTKPRGGRLNPARPHSLRPGPPYQGPQARLPLHRAVGGYGQVRPLQGLLSGTARNLPGPPRRDRLPVYGTTRSNF